MKVKLTLPTAQSPLRANPTDAGADLFCTTNRVIAPHESIMIDFGIQMEIPNGYVGLIPARSGLGSKGIRPRNCIGIIDSKYRGNIKIMLENSTDEPYRVYVGDRIAQFVVVPIITPEFEVVDELDMVDDRLGGFGHTGK